MINRIKSIRTAAKRAGEEAGLWTVAGWSLPFAALAIIVFEYLIGWNDLIAKTIVIIAVVFITVGVFWWWWAIHKIVKILDSISDTEDRFEEIKQELRETRKAIRGE
jgi:ABC-type siderophore export system fused ATPase/permease subunit